MLDDLLALRMAETPASLRHAGVGLDRLRHRARTAAADARRLDPRAGRLDRRSGRSASTGFRSPARSSASTGISRGERCGCRSRSRPARRATRCAPNSPRPRSPAATGMFALGGGWIVLDPLTPDDEALVLKRVVMRGSIDPTQQRITLEQGDLGTKELGGQDDKAHRRAVRQVRLRRRAAACARASPATRCRPAAIKRLWPSFLAPKVRDWVVRARRQRQRRAHRHRDQCARLPRCSRAARRCPTRRCRSRSSAARATLRPVAGLPAIRDADLNVRVNGRTAKVTLGKGTVDVSPGRRLTISNGVFEVPDIRIKTPPARVRLPHRGLGSGRRRTARARPAARILRRAVRSGRRARHGHARRSTSACRCVPICRRARPTTTITVDLSNFSADKMVFGQQGRGADAAGHRQQPGLRDQGRRQDRRRAGADRIPQARNGEPEAEVRLQATLDEAARARLGLDLGPAVTGPLPIKLTGRVGQRRAGRPLQRRGRPHRRRRSTICCRAGSSRRAGRRALPSPWSSEKTGLRFDDLLLDGQGVLAKGSRRARRQRRSAVREPSGVRHLRRRQGLDQGRPRRRWRAAGGDARRRLRRPQLRQVRDGRSVATRRPRPRIPTSISTSSSARLPATTARPCAASTCACRAAPAASAPSALNAKIGRDTPLIGDMRTRVANGRPVLYFETNDAGALFRFTDIYPRMVGGQMWVGMDPPTQDACAAGRHPQHVSNFPIRGEGALDRVVAGAAERRAAERQHRVLAGARRLHPLARPHVDPRRRGARADHRRHRRRPHRLRARRRARARHVRAALRPQQHVRPDSDRRPVPRRRQQRRLVRHHLRSGRPDRQSAADGQSDLGGRAGPAAQVLRVPRPASDRDRAFAEPQRQRN